MKTVGKIINIILVAVLSLLLLFNVIALFSKVVLKNPFPSIFGYALVSINEGAGSMAPTLMPKDYFIIKKQKGYGVGDIITYQDGTMVVTHRIIAQNLDGSYQTKGDANNSADISSVATAEIYGKIVAMPGGFSKFMNFITTPFGILACLAIGFGIIYLPQGLKKITQKNKENGQQTNEN